MQTWVATFRKWFVTASQWQWLAVGVLLLTFTLNTHHLNSECVWTDEGLTLTFASGPTTNILQLYGEIDEYHPPLHYLAWHFWIELTGSSEFAIRAFPALLGVLTVAMIYQLGKSLFGTPVGLVAGLLVASSGFQVYYSQTVRVYCLLELLSAGSFFACFKLTRGFSFKTMAAYALVTTALLFTHLYGLLVVGSENLFVGIWLIVTTLKNGWPGIQTKARHWIFLQITLGLAFMFWAPVVIYQFQHFTTDVASQPVLGLLIGTFLEFTWSVPAFVVSVCILALAGYTCLRQRVLQPPTPTLRLRSNSQYGNLLVGIWLMGLFGLPVAISILVKPVFLPRYGISALPAFYLLVSWLAVKQLRPLMSGLLIGAMLIFQLVGVANLDLAVNNEDWRAATPYLEAAAHPGDFVLFYSGWAKGAFDYNARRSDLQLMNLRFTDGPGRVQKILDANPHQPTVWYALTYADPSSFESVMHTHGYKLAQQGDFFRVTILQYQKASP